MDFKYKCFLQTLFSHIPGGDTFNFVFQKYVTRSLPVSNETFLQKVKLSYEHYQKFLIFNSTGSSGYKYYEFGAGWDLITPVSMGLLGFEVTCADIKRLVLNQLIYDTLAKFICNVEQIPFSTKQLCLEKNRNQLNYLQNELRINYIAPLDARDTKLNPDCFDLATSTSTFEHIPEKDLLLILNETYRILKPGGILSLVIDYQDHWSYFDKKLSIYNFLKYSDHEWGKFNPSMHYQNRLRHSDYLKIVSKTNFQVMEVISFTASDEEIESLQNLQINAMFKSHNMNELSLKGSHIILKKQE